MLHSLVTPAEKRAALRRGLQSDRPMLMPGAFSPLCARLIEDKSFDGVYVSGAVVSADLLLPDIGLTTLSEVVQRSGQIARATSLPVLADADTGFGEPSNVARTVQLMEDAGVAGLHLEDQVNPKRCGHLDGKSIVEVDVAVRRIRAAVLGRRDPGFVLIARTDARAVDGLEPMIERARRYVDAGADAIFPEALETLDEFSAVRAAVDVPILANMTEFGKSELFTTRQLADVGINIIIFPVSLLRLAMYAAERGLDALRSDGTLSGLVPNMQTRSRLYELLDYAGYVQFDNAVLDADAASHVQ